MNARVVVAHAYSPRPSAAYATNGEHLMVKDDTLMVGRIVRYPYQTLCSRRRWWGLDSGPGWGAPTCQRCIAVARRHGIAFPGSEKAPA